MPVNTSVLLLAIGAVVLVLALFFRPARKVLLAILKTIGGATALILLNVAGQSVGFGIGVNVLNACLIGLLGIPGLATALFLNWLY